MSVFNEASTVAKILQQIGQSELLEETAAKEIIAVNDCSMDDAAK